MPHHPLTTMQSATTEMHSKIPEALRTFRSRETKVLGVALAMTGIILLMALVPVTSIAPSALVQSGVPIVTALLFIVSGTLTILIEQRPGRVLGYSTAACLALGAALGGPEMVVYLMDINKLQGMGRQCDNEVHILECLFHNHEQVLASSIPAAYLLTLTGILLCAVLFVILFQFLRDWRPEDSRGSMTSPAIEPEETSLVVEEHGIDPDEGRRRDEGEGSRRDRGPPRAGETLKSSVLLEKFLESQPKILGVLLLMSAFGLVLLSLPTLAVLHVEYVRLSLVWWSFLQSLVSGILSIIAAVYPTTVMIRACFGLNIVSAISSSIVALFHLDHAHLLVFCMIVKCKNTVIFTQHIFNFLIQLLMLVLSSVLAAYSRKALKSLSISKTTLVVNPVSIQQSSEEHFPPE